MFCTECGSELPDDAQFCTNCGARLADDDKTTVMPAADKTVAAPYTNPEAPGAGQAPVPQPQGQPMPQPSPQPAGPNGGKPKGSRKKVVAIAVAAVVVLAAAGVGGFLLWRADQDRAAQEEYDAAHRELSLALPVSISGLDASQGSMIPVSIKGTDLDGNEVDEVQYVDEDGENLSLLQGTYTLSIPASPIAEDGTVYEIPTDSAEVEITEDTEDLSAAGVFAFTETDAADVTDDQIDSAYQYAKDGGAESSEKAEELRDAATKRRDDAVAEKEAAEQREAQSQYHIVADSFEIDVPTYWRGKVTWDVNGNEVVFYSTAYPDREVARVYWQYDATNIQGDISYLGDILCEDSSRGVVAFSAPNYSYNVPWALRANSTNPSDYYTEDEADTLIGLQSGGAHTYDQALSGYDAGDYSVGTACASYMQSAFNATFR